MKHTNCASPEETSGAVIRKQKRNDRIFLLTLLLLVGIAGLCGLLFRTAGDTVVVLVDGRVYGEYSLHENRRVEITNGEGWNILVIADGKAFIEMASCPDGICSAHRPVQHNGESIICLPNKVVVEIHAEAKDEPDIIT